MLNHRSVKSDSHGLISQMRRLMTTVRAIATVKLTSPIDTMAARTTPITMPTRIPKVISDAKTRRATAIPELARDGAEL